MRIIRILGLAVFIITGLLLASPWAGWPKGWQGTLFLPSGTSPHKADEEFSGDKALPWAGDKTVEEFLQKHNTPILMALGISHYQASPRLVERGP